MTHTAENDALADRADAALDAYFLERIEHDDPPESSSFGCVAPPATQPPDVARVARDEETEQ